MTKTQLTENQIILARHALGLANYCKTSYRNHFVCSSGSDDHKEWDDMVSKGFAKVRRNHPLCPSDDCFWLTLAGAKAALKSGDKLCKKDFPND